ncbi:MAG: ornithine carbamoyltransferase [Bacteroidota bacterium]
MSVKKDFISIHDWTVDEIQHFFTIAEDMKANQSSYWTVLRGKTLAMIFEKQSLRTRVTFQVGIQQLGGHAVYLAPVDISLGKRESVYDVAKNLERWVDGIMIRTFGHSICTDMARYAKIPVINGLTDLLHPCQAMADYFTMLEIKKTLKGLKVAFAGDGNNVSHSLMFGGAKVGAHVWVATPKGYEPKKEIVDAARDDAKLTGATINVTNDLAEAVRNADVVYTDVWASMGQESEAEVRDRIFRPYQVNSNVMRLAKPDAIFLHCLPAHRGDEVTDEVIDSPQSVVFQEAENRLHVQKAIMYELMKG